MPMKLTDFLVFGASNIVSPDASGLSLIRCIPMITSPFVQQ
jgi:hypothetical protein